MDFIEPHAVIRALATNTPKPQNPADPPIPVAVWQADSIVAARGHLILMSTVSIFTTELFHTVLASARIVRMPTGLLTRYL